MERWIETKSIFDGNTDEDYDIGIDKPDKKELAKFSFDLNDVVAYNDHDEGCTIMFKSGRRFVITMSYLELQTRIKTNIK